MVNSYSALDRKIRSQYNTTQKLLLTQPGAEKVLSTLIDLEDSIQERLFAAVKDKYGEQWDQSTIKKTFDSNPQWRKKLEKAILRKSIKKETTISELLDCFIEALNKNLDAPIPIEEKLQNLNIAYREIDDTILPPEGMFPSLSVDPKKEEKLRVDFDKFSLLLKEVLIPMGITTDSLAVVLGTNGPNMMRKDSYIAVYIPKLNKTLFINNGYGEATFIYDGFLSSQDFIEKGKNSLNDELSKITFSLPYQKEWIARMKEELSSGEIGAEALSFKETIKEINKAEQRQKIIDTLRSEPGKIERKKLKNTKARSSFKMIIEGKKIGYIRILTLLNEEKIGKGVCLTSNDHYRTISRIVFGEESEDYKDCIKDLKDNEFKKLTEGEQKQKVIDTLKSEPGKTAWKTLNTKKKRAGGFGLIIEDLEETVGYTRISTLINGEPLGYEGFDDDNYETLSRIIFGEESKDYKECIAALRSTVAKEKKQKVIDTLKNEPWKTERKKLTTKKKRGGSFKIIVEGEELGYSKISTLLNEEPLGYEGFNNDNHRRLSKIIFGEKSEDYKESIKDLKDSDFEKLSEKQQKQKIISVLKSLSGKKERKVLRTPSKRSAFRIMIEKEEISYSRISTLFNKKSLKGDAISDDNYCKLSGIVFGENSEDYKDCIMGLRLPEGEQKQKILDALKSAPWKTERKKLKTVNKRANFKIKIEEEELGYARISTLLNEERVKENILYDDNYYTLSKLIFGEESEDYADCINGIITRDLVLDTLRSELGKAERKKLKTPSQRHNFKIVIGDEEVGYLRIFKLIGEKKAGDKSIEDGNYLNCSAIIFGEESEDYKDCMKGVITRDLVLNALKSVPWKTERKKLKNVGKRSYFKIKIGEKEVGYRKISSLLGREVLKDGVYYNANYLKLSAILFGEESQDYKDCVNLLKNKG